MKGMSLKSLLWAIVCTVVLLGVVNPAQAYPVKVGDSVKFQETGAGYPGGEFNVYVNGSKIPSYITFCVELNEYLNMGVPYKVSSIEDYAVEGGISGQTQPGKDYLDKATTYLFSKFSSNTLTGYTHTLQSGNALQYDIWYLEGELTYDEWYGLLHGSNQVVNNIHLAKLDNTYAAWAQTWYNDATSQNKYYNVKVVNVVDANGNPKQSTLVAPEPASLLLLGLGFAALALARSRRAR